MSRVTMTVILSFLSLQVSPLFSQNALHHSMPYTPEELVDDADTEAVNFILNFLYWSYRRSSATQEMQQTLRRQLIQTLSDLEGFNHLRHNPERSLHASHEKATTNPTIDFATYETISHTYATCCKTILADDTPLPHDIRNRLTTIRAHVRGEISAILATKLMETYGILSYVYDGLQNLYTSFAQLLFKAGGSDEERGPSLFSMLWTYMPSFLINVMYQFEDKHLELREELCDVLLEDIRISDELWNEIESIRSHVYKTLYTQVYHHVTATCDDDNILKDRFSQSDQQRNLPSPYELETKALRA